MKKNFSYTAEQRRALDAFVKLARAANAVTQRTQRYTKWGLTTSQFGVLEALYHLGPLRQSQLAEKILKTPGNLTMVLDNLEKRGLIEKTRETEDRRALQITLTKDGNDLIAEIFPKHAEDVLQAMSNLTGSEQQSLAELCQKLGTGKPAGTND